MHSIDVKIETWKNKLLDLGKRNRLINFKETKRSNLNITSPNMEEIFNYIVTEEKTLTFSYPIEKELDLDSNIFNQVETPKTEITIVDGDLTTHQTIVEQQKTLKSLRTKARTAIEECGTNILYIAFGFLNWKESISSSQVFTSPIILVPVTLTVSSLTSPYKIKLHDDEIVLNPSLKHKFENDFNIIFPEFDSNNNDINSYIKKLNSILEDFNWTIESKISLSLFSFLKINMYVDIDKHTDILKNNFAIKALAGDTSEISTFSDDFKNYDHDKNNKPLDIFQIVDADSSQQDAIVLSKKGTSFVLQGPPGTGKSQTITNIISEALADGKKILFVSEKMAALDVVYNRLSKVNLSDFCLPLHSHKANKKDILKNLGDTLNLDRIKIKDEAIHELDILLKERELLNQYTKDLHTIIQPFNKTIFEVNGLLAKLKNAPNIIFNLDDIEIMSSQSLKNYEYLLDKFSNTIEKLSEEYDINVWKGSNVSQVTHELRHDIEFKINSFLKSYQHLESNLYSILNKLSFEYNPTFNDLDKLNELFTLCEIAPNIPKMWLKKENINDTLDIVHQFSAKQSQYHENYNIISIYFNDTINNNDIISSNNNIKGSISKLILNINNIYYPTKKSIFDNKDNIISICESGICLIDEINIIISDSNEKLNILYGKTLSEVKNYILILSKLNKISCATPLWFEDTTNTEINILKLNNIANDLYLYRNELSLLEKTIDINPLNQYFNNTVLNFETLITNNITTIKGLVLNIREYLTPLYEYIQKINTNFDLCIPTEISSSQKISELVSCLEKSLYPTELWFEIGGIVKVQTQLNLLQKNKKMLDELKQRLFANYEQPILSIDYKEILNRFKNEHNNLLKIFKSKYKEDIATVKQYQRNFSNKLTDTDIIDVLNLISDIKQLESTFNDLDGINHFGALFKGMETPFEIISNNLESFSNLVNIIKIDIPNKLKVFLLECRNVFEFDISKEKVDKLSNSIVLNNFNTAIIGDKADTMPIEKIIDIADTFINITINIDKLTECKNDYETNKSNFNKYFDKFNYENKLDIEFIFDSFKSLTTINEYLGNDLPNEIKELILNRNNNDLFINTIKSIQDKLNSDGITNLYNLTYKNQDTDITEVKVTLNEILSNMNILTNEINEIKFHTKNELDFEFIIECTEKLSSMQETLIDFTSNETLLLGEFDFKFQGISTDWNSIKNGIDWTIKFAPYIDDYSLSNKFINNVLSLKYIDKFSIFISNINLFIDSTKEDFNWLNNLYEPENQMWDLPLKNTIDKLCRCIDNLHGLEEWIDFKNARENCYKNNLGEVVTVLLKEKIQAENVVKSFKKRFYRLWLDLILPQYPSVFNFRRKTHEEILSRFKEFDLKQMTIAQLRIRASLIQKLPDMNRTTSALDEIGILKRELAKQRKIMPIRKLFTKIPNLLAELKPCLMMSPLSVSLFLQSEIFKFDLVIFDEASQVCTENAIGAIMRSKQIIVAGDNKQLPPTKFFGTTTSDNDDFDNEDDDVDEEENFDYESILDEMLTVFPERSLKWHYRSKSEDLISFSNIKIYNQSLITFPSSAQNTPNNGVEYIYVNNGVYDRGGKKNNVIEAKKIATLVFEHFKTFKNRSLGVIAFSEAQQNTIDEEITKLRISNPSYEKYFNDDCEEAFFVKNLENVQGDERDTIIFGIGYAKDKNNVMYMNFGPLSKNGGYRRLNVAITRAKYNLKLVGSIHPTDINLEKTNSDGVKMLRSYIEFAINGQSALDNELKYNNIVDVDSPFEESVYEFLIGKGYKVSTQVGCSGYRIDMAVHHPKYDGKFVIAIECDGATYHSSRTARERDRLRQTVLEDMGWTFHRIWSTDWIKDSFVEGEHLINAIENSITKYSQDYKQNAFNNSNSYNLNNDIEIPNNEIYYEIEENVELNHENTELFFDEYLVPTFESISKANNPIKYIIENEYPIHYELLCKRISPFYGNKKVTSKIRNIVSSRLLMLKDEIIKIDDFYYPNPYGEIKPRRPYKDDVQRPIEYISNEEISVAMTTIIQSSIGLSKVNLFAITSKQLGFSRSGDKIKNSFDKVFEELLNNEKIVYLEDKIKII